MKFKHLVIIFFFLTVSVKSFSTHIVGGEIFYDCLGGNNYKITLKLYRDCFNGIPPFDSPATIFIFDASGNFIDSIQMAAPPSVILPFPLSNPCLDPPTNICYEEAIYETNINLPDLAGGYNFVYQRCCRNGTILNLINPGDVGSSYMAHIPDPGLAICNSSPRYNNFPPIFLCSGVPLSFDHSATDLDGDSLHYTLCDPFTGLTPSCPILGPQSTGGCNDIADPPTYPFVPWLSPYSGSYPMSSSPALAVDPTTGLMTGTPNMIGQWVIGVCVEEYRNGVLISVNKRDFQFNVVECGIPVASVPTLQPFCFGTPSNFSQTSINAFTYHWDFGETGLTNDTSNLLAPSWTYSALGTYNVLLIVNPNTLCTDSAIIPVTVYPLPVMNSIPSDSVCDAVAMNITLSANTASTFTWQAVNNANTTGESTTIQSSATIGDVVNNNSTTNQNIVYSVIPSSSPGGCVGPTQTVTVTVHPAPTITNNPVTICNGVALNMGIASDIPASFSWSATDNTNTTGETTTSQTSTTIADLISNPTDTIQQVVYSVVATSTANGCVAPSQNINVDVIPPPTIANLTDSALCSGELFTMPLDASVPSTYTWIATDNSNVNGESTVLQTGSPINNTLISSSTSNQIVVYTITPTSISGGCLGIPFTLNATVYPSISADFGFTKVPCVNQVTFNDSSIASPASWLWYFGDGDSSIVQNPSHAYDSIGVYDVQLIVETANGCRDTTDLQIDFIGPNPVSISSDTSVCLGNSVQLSATGGFAYSWSPANTLSDSDIANPVATPTDTTLYSVIVSSLDNFGDSCTQTISTTVFTIDPDLYTIDATADNDTILEGESTTLHALTDTSLVVIWNPASEVSNQNDLNPSVSPATTTTFIVSILDSVGCPRMDSITVYVLSNKCEEESVFVPNTFTPNGDGKNDILYVRGNTLKKIYFAVYNRRGELIFETEDITKGWDGNYAGKAADPDVFAWYLRATCFSNAELITKGNVTIIR